MPESIADLQIQLATANTRILELESQLAVHNDQRYRSIVENQTELICRYTPDFILTYVNPAYSSLFGLTPKKMIGINLLSFIPDEDRLIAIELIRTLTVTSPVCISEHRAILSNGSVRWYEWTDRAMFDPAGQVVEYQGVARDITERKKLEAAQAQNTRTIEEVRLFLQSTLDVLASHIAVLAPDGNIIKVNAAWQCFARDNSATIPLTDVGVNYLSVCDTASGPFSQEAPLMAEGIRSVISGERDNFYLEYPCNTENSLLWFATNVTPFNEPAPRRVVVAHTDITERVQAQENFSSLNTILAQSRDLVATAGPSGKITYLNAGGAAMLGYSSPEVTGHTTVLDFHLVKDARRVIEEYIPIAIQTGEWRGENRLKTCNGELIDVEQTIFALHDREGNLKAYATIMVDITERKRTLKALKDSEEKYRSLIESSNSSIGMLDWEGNFLFANKIAAERFGLQPETIVGRNIKELMPSEEAAARLRVVRRVIDTGQGRVIEIPGTLNGEIHWFHTSIQPVLDPSGTPFAALINSIDITNLKQAEAARRESEELLQELMKHLPGTVAILDHKNTLLFCNEFYAKTTGYPREEILGKELKTFLQPEVYGNAIKQIEQVFSQNKVIEFGIKAAESLHWKVILFPIPRQGLPPNIGAIGLDITREKEAEEVLKKAHDQLEQRVKERTTELEGTKNRLEAIFNSSSDCILLLDTEAVILQANHTFDKMFGFENYVGRQLLELIQPKDLGRLEASILEVAKTQKAYQLEILTNRADGSQVETEVSFAPVSDSSQPVSNLVCIIRDITERNRAQKAIAEERNLLRTLIDAIPDFIYIKDIEHRMLLNNKAHARSLGNKTPEEVVGTIDFDFFPIDMATKFYEDETTLFHTQQPLVSVEEASIGVDGNEIWASTTKVPLKNLAGEIIGLVGITHDISNIKASEEALRRSEEKLRESQQMLVQVLDTIPVRVFWKDLDLVYQGCNRLFADDAALATTTAIIGKRDEDMPWLVADTRAYVADDRGVIESGKAKLDYEEKQTTLAGGELTLQTSKLPLRNAAGDIIGVLGTYIDITARKATEEALQRNQADLKSIIESSSLSFILCDLEGNIRVVNQHAQEFSWTHYARRPEPGHSMLESLPPGEHPLFLERLARVRAGESLTFVNVIKKADRTTYVEFRYYPVKTQQGNIIGVNIVFEDITARNETELQLRFLADLQDNMLEAVIATDLEFNIKSWNKAAEVIYGWEASEVIGKAMREIITTNIATNQTTNEAAQILREKGFWSGEVVQKRRDGAEINILSSIVLLKDSEGSPTGVLGVNHDITTKKQADIVLEEKRQLELELQEYLKALHETSVELAAIFKLDEFYKKVVQFGLERLGFERLGFFLYDPNTKLAIGTYGTDAQGKLIPEHGLKFDPTAYTGIMKQAMHHPDRYTYAEEARLYSNGEYIGMGWNAAVSLWQSSELLGWLTIDSGVSHKPVASYTLEVLSLYRMTVAVLLANKLVEEKLQSSSQRLKLATHTGGIGIWEMNLVDRILIWDDQMLALYGVAREDFTGKAKVFQKAVHPDDWERVDTELRTTIHQGKALDSEFRIFWPNGALRYIKSNAIIIGDEEGQPQRLVGVNWDITNLKRSEETLKDALKKEKELGELKTRFVSRASHEFRTPLAAILATTETLTVYRDKMTETQLDARLDKIRQQVMYLKDIMEDVLQLSRFQSGRMEFRPSQGNLDELCQNIVTEFESQAEYKNRIIYKGTNAPLVATFDTRLIRQVISNLVSNALKYSPVEKSVYLELSQDSTKITLTVRDEGIGIPPEDMKSLFEPFQRASNVGTIAGTGLGLSIALQAVEMHKGTILVESQVSVGTTFTLTIPKLPVKGNENDEDISN